VHAGFFDVLHDAANDHIGAVGEGVHVHFRRFFEELINQHGPSRPHQRRLSDIALYCVDVIRDNHGPAAKYVTRAHQYGQADLRGHARGFFRNQRCAIARLRNLQFFQQAAKAPPVFRQVNGFRSRTNDGHTVAFQFQRKIQRRLPAKLHDDALRLFAFDDGEHVFQCQRLKIQAVRSVVVGRNRLRIAIHHDGFETVFVQRIGSVAAAIIKLNALPDAVRAAPQNHDFWPRLRVRFVLVLVSRVEIRREGFKLRGARVHAFENRRDAVARALQADGSWRGSPNLRQLLVAGTVPFDFAQQILRSRLDRNARGAAVHCSQLFDLVDEPRIDLCQLANFLGVQAALHRGQQPVNAVGPRRSELFAQQRIRRLRRSAPGRARLQRANTFLQRFFERPADGHHLADGLHLRAKSAVRTGELLKLPFRDFHHYVVYGRLKTSRSLLRNVVGNLVETHSHSEPRGNFRNGETRGFAGERRTA